MVGYIGEFSGQHLVYSVVDNVWSVTGFESEGLCHQRMKEMKASAMVILFEEFLIIDSQISDGGKDVVSYKELRKRLQDYITWSLEFGSINPEKVVLNGFKMRKIMFQMIGMISKEHELRKKLIFVWFNVTKLYEQPYNIQK